MSAAAADALRMEAVPCCICGTGDAIPIGNGEDFEYRSSPDRFVAMRCRRCDLVYLSPRPALEDQSVLKLPSIAIEMLRPGAIAAFASADA